MYIYAISTIISLAYVVSNTKTLFLIQTLFCNYSNGPGKDNQNYYFDIIPIILDLKRAFRHYI